MKPMNDENGGGTNNWLGFSLESPHDMKIEGPNNNNTTCSPVDPHEQQFINHSLEVTTTPTNSSAVAPANFYLPSSSSYHLNMSSYGVVAENGDFNPPLSVVMPLKSDGSLCIMEALSTSHPQVMPNSSPKLEDFLGSGATTGGGHHEYGGHSRDSSSSSMVLSLDRAFYNQDPFAVRQQHQQQQQQQQQQQHQYYYYYPGLNSNSNIPLYETEVPLNIKQQPQMPHTLVSPDNEIPCLKTWNLEQQQNHGALQLQVNSNNNHSVNTASMVEESGARMGGCGDLQSLSLSMSPGSQSSSCVTAPSHASTTNNTTAGREGVIVAAMENSKKRGPEKMLQKQTVHRKSIDTFGQRTSQYRGVTRHRWTGRYEAHLWDNSCKKEGQTRKGRQVYLGGYDMEEKAARAYDLAALKYWGTSTHINFALENYHQELEEMKNMSRQEFVAHLRRRSSGFSRGASIYRGVTRHHQHGRWQARIGRVAGNKDLYLGTFSTQEEAAEAYDIAAIKFRGVNAVTNFDITRYDVEKIMASNTLPTGDIARRNKDEKPQVIADDTIGNVSDWKMVLQNQGHQEGVVTIETTTMNNAGNYQNPPFMALHDLIGLDSSQTVAEESRATVAQHFSNSSSLVTSLSSSREASPDKNGSHILFSKPSSNNTFATNVHSWIPAAQLRPSLPLTTAHLPVFAAWNDA